eukprot:CAMPEP_0172299422 /NCGR_PEP_ID=MMETSP1058-20130122/1738_1 /TAXON_ID=83371 /ORGANISM="Detonula confervacea, Strain CCMP 353" /LENGTH=611 /DNA_ID=CAMNT_0013008869 /DNA_START=157 /DNA_END=1992 /DNA_ORIENTATION=+
MMKKNRIVTRVKDKTGIAKSKNRSEDLNDLRSKYTQFAKNQKFLITTLTNNHASMAAYSKSRLEVAKAINSLTVDTPLFKCAGDIPANAVGTTDGGGGNSTSTDIVPHQSHPSSYAAIHLQLHKKNKMYLEKYTEHILNYATEWERILSTRITGHLKQSEKLRVDLDHYARKVEDMNKTMNKTMSKGKSINDAGVDKLKRNEQKLSQARQEYDRFVNDLCGFMEEVMERGWKDLHPLLVKMAQFDATLSNEEAVLLKGSMAGVTENLKGMGTKYPNLKAQGRLKELETWSLESLNKVNPSSRSDSPLMITHGGGENASYVTQSSGGGDPTLGIHAGLGAPSDGSLDLNAGGGGFFGSSGQISGSQISRTSSFASNSGSDAGGGYGAPQQPRSRTNTGDSGGGGYDWNVAGGTRSASYRGAPSSGGLPPLNPQRQGSFHELPQRASSAHDMSATSSMLSAMQAAAPPPTMDDIFGGSNSANAGMPPPPSGMPPPPPSMPPPPPPQALSPNVSQLSLYDHGSSPLPPAPPPMYGGGCLSPQMSVASHGTNPFDDAFGPGGGTPGAGTPHGTPMQGNPYGNMTPTQGNPYGNNPPTSTQGNPYGGGGAPSNPFG